MAYIVSTPPHVKAEEGIPKIMLLVVLALLPAFVLAPVVFQSWWPLVVTALCVTACVATEVACQKLRGVPVTINDWSAVVTGLLLAAVIPPYVSWWVPVLGGAFAIGVAKHCFGGLGNNIWNPALLARAFLQNALPPQINAGFGNGNPDLWQKLYAKAAGEAAHSPDVVSSATVLTRIHTPLAKSADFRINDIADCDLVLRTWFGFEGGTIAEVSAGLLLLGGIYLLLRKIITWEIPIGYIATAGLLAWILPAPFKYLDPAVGKEVVLYTAWCSGPWLLHLGAGGLMIGAWFMATDMVTSPMTSKGKLIFGIGCGLLTICIRLYAGYPEGVCYSILIMNTCVPLIDSWTRPKKFGLKPQTA
jgi:electron transport complex protein RnfD